MKGSVTLPRNVLRRWLEAENAFIDAETEYRSARNSGDVTRRWAAEDVATEKLRELFAARRAIDIVLRLDKPTSKAIAEVIAENAAELRGQR